MDPVDVNQTIEYTLFTMANLDKEAIKSLTQLSRIHCSEADEEALLGDLKKILNYIDQLNEIDTENVAPCNHVLEGICNVMSEDVVEEPLSRDLFLENAPAKIGGLVRVPPVIKQS